MHAELISKTPIAEGDHPSRIWQERIKSLVEMSREITIVDRYAAKIHFEMKQRNKSSNPRSVLHISSEAMRASGLVLTFQTTVAVA